MFPFCHVSGRPAWVHKKLYGALGDRLSGRSRWHTTGPVRAEGGDAMLAAAVRGPPFLPGTAPLGVGTPPPGAAGFLGGVSVDRPPPAEWPGGKLGERAVG